MVTPTIMMREVPPKLKFALKIPEKIIGIIQTMVKPIAPINMI
jgi:hypothetical protein